MTYNIKAYDLKLAREFLRRGIPVDAFDTSDGGGWNGYIVEFQRREDLEAYCREIEGIARLRCWIEHDDGRHEDISDNMATFVSAPMRPKTDAPAVEPLQQVDAADKSQDAGSWSI